MKAVRPSNCRPMHLRCLACGQTHLRDGYCQALDPQDTWRSGALGVKWLAYLETGPGLDPKVYEAPVPLGITPPVTSE